MNQFMDQATERLLQKITTTRQMKRRQVALKTLDALDLVKAEFYAWLNGAGAKT